MSASRICLRKYGDVYERSTERIISTQSIIKSRAFARMTLLTSVLLLVVIVSYDLRIS